MDLTPKQLKRVKKYLTGDRKEKTEEVISKGTPADIRYMEKYNKLMKELGQK